MQRIHQCHEHSTQEINHLSREAENCLGGTLWRLILLRTSHDLYFHQHLRSTPTCSNFLGNLTGITINIDMSEILLFLCCVGESLLEGRQYSIMEYHKDFCSSSINVETPTCIMYPMTRSGLGATLKEWPSMICVVTQLQLMNVLIVLPASTLSRQRTVRDFLSLVSRDRDTHLMASWVQVLF